MGGRCSIPVGPVCRAGTSSISIAWELVGSANSQPSPEPETDWIRNSGGGSLPAVSYQALRGCCCSSGLNHNREKSGEVFREWVSIGERKDGCQGTWVSRRIHSSVPRDLGQFLRTHFLDTQYWKVLSNRCAIFSQWGWGNSGLRYRRGLASISQWQSWELKPVGFTSHIAASAYFCMPQCPHL